MKQCFACVQALGSLPGEKLARVLEIISEGANALATGGSAEEVELDIDMLDNATLFKLDQYTTEILAVRRLLMSGLTVVSP